MTTSALTDALGDAMEHALTAQARDHQEGEDDPLMAYVAAALLSLPPETRAAIAAEIYPEADPTLFVYRGPDVDGGSDE